MKDVNASKFNSSSAVTLRRRPVYWPKRRSEYAHPKPSVRQVVADLEAGRVASLAEHIKDRDCRIDEQVALALYDLVVGTANQISFRLTTVRHPDAGPNRTPISEANVRNANLALALAAFRRAYTGRHRERTIETAAKSHGLAFSTVRAALSRMATDPDFAHRMETLALLLEGKPSEPLPASAMP